MRSTDLGPALVEHSLNELGIPAKLPCSQVLSEASGVALAEITAGLTTARNLLANRCSESGGFKVKLIQAKF